MKWAPSRRNSRVTFGVTAPPKRNSLDPVSARSALASLRSTPRFHGQTVTSVTLRYASVTPVFRRKPFVIIGLCILKTGCNTCNTLKVPGGGGRVYRGYTRVEESFSRGCYATPLPGRLPGLNLTRQPGLLPGPLEGGQGLRVAILATRQPGRLPCPGAATLAALAHVARVYAPLPGKWSRVDASPFTRTVARVSSLSRGQGRLPGWRVKSYPGRLPWPGAATLDLLHTVPWASPLARGPGPGWGCTSHPWPWPSSSSLSRGHGRATRLGSIQQREPTTMWTPRGRRGWCTPSVMM